MGRFRKIWRIRKRMIAGLLALVLGVSGISVPVPALGSNVWPQKSTAPFYCLDGGKGWKASDRYEIYKYDTLPSALTEIQARRLFWAYPSNWNALKEAAAKYDTELYAAISTTVSGPNIVKKVKDDKSTKFAWVADNPEIEARAIGVLEKMAGEAMTGGKDAPAEIRDATSEEQAVSITVPAFNSGPASLNTEFKLDSEFIRDIAKIEAQSVWDNGSTGGDVGWLDASQEKNIVKAVMGDELYEITWSGDSIKIHNNGSAVANENAIGSEMSDEERYNKTTVRYKITMRENSGWYTEGSWNDNYLREWMDFKACTNSPGHQRLYKADIRIVPSDQVFYLVIGQGESADLAPAPEYGTETVDVEFQIFKHEETFESTYNVKLKKIDDETEMPLKGSQFYLYEAFESDDMAGEDEWNGGLSGERLSFRPWSGFQIFSEGTTDEKGELVHTDSRSYIYSKTYCDGHKLPDWVNVKEEDDDETESEDEESEGNEEEEGKDSAKDANRNAAMQWMELVEACNAAAEGSGGTHFHWLVEEGSLEEVQGVLDSGEAEELIGSAASSGLDSQTAFEQSGCKDDCEATYENFINLRFSYTWKEIQARTGYILHGVHEDDRPIEVISTNASEAGADAVLREGSSDEIEAHVWYTGNNEERRSRQMQAEILLDRHVEIEQIEGMNAGKDFYEKEQEPGETVALMQVTLEAAKGKVWNASDSNSGTDFNPTTSSNATTDSNAASNSNAKSEIKAKRRGIFSAMADYLAHVFEMDDGDESEDDYDDEWESSGNSGAFEMYLASAEEDGIHHIEKGSTDIFSYPNDTDPNRDYWLVRNHRTEGEIHINKRDMDLYKGESGVYSAYGDTEGDGTLEGAIYGLFAAEDILHPDSDLLSHSEFSNTGFVYRKNDLVSVAETDSYGNASFENFTVAPGMTYDYETNRIVKREDMTWAGPVNRYEENQALHGNWWISRPLILGKYYVKELSRSEGYELSVNGKTADWTNYGAGYETPKSIADSNGTAIVSMPELAAAMEGDDERGTGYDELPFYVTSSGTTNMENGSNGYDIVISGLPEGCEFYRVDSGEQEVTAPRVVGTEEVILKNADGTIIWQTAESDTSNVKYEPEYDESGAIAGQVPVSRIEPQVLKADQIPEIKQMNIEDWEVDFSDERWGETIREIDVESDGEGFFFLKAEIEDLLSRNGYEVPVTAAGIHSRIQAPVYSVGVLKNQPDVYGMTTSPGEPALKTVYGAAVKEIFIEDVTDDTTVYELFLSILSWYHDNPQWSYGGIHAIEMEGNECKITLYAGASTKSSRRFFTMKSENGKKIVDHVYSVYENPKTLRWVYQEYGREGSCQYRVNRQYYHGSGMEKRYYIDATLTPAMMVNHEGEMQAIERNVMVYHSAGEEIIDYLIGDPENGYRVPATELVDRIEITMEKEQVEQDVRLENVSFDSKTGIYTISIDSNGTDSFGKSYSDAEESLTLSFMAKLPESKTVISDEDLALLGTTNVQGFQVGDEIGYAESLVRFGGMSVSVATGNGEDLADTYIVSKQLVYRSQYKVAEDGDTDKVPVQVLERPIKQKVEVIKEIKDEEAVGNFRFKIYLKSNLERLFCNEDGEIIWVDRDGSVVDIQTYKDVFPELVQKIYTKPTNRKILETVKRTTVSQDGKREETETYNYEKFFDAIEVANTDQWNHGGFYGKNTSWKPFAANQLTGIANEINTSAEAKENAKRSDAVRQFAVTWYLEKYIQSLVKELPESEGFQAKDGAVSYSDEVYDRALYLAILEAEEYLKPFFTYDLDSIYEIFWDSETAGGRDGDKSTLSTDQLDWDNGSVESAFGISKYLPYGDYVLVEQQPYHAAWSDFENRHYEIDTPKELSLPVFYDEQEERVYSSLVPWSMTEPGIKKEMSGYASQIFVNRRYFVNLRVEKLDAETGEPVLHDGAVFALYRAERNEAADGDGSVKRYEEDTLISGSRAFLRAMGAKEITPFARSGILGFWSSKLEGPDVGNRYTGRVPAGTPICREEDCIIFCEKGSYQEEYFAGLSTVKSVVDLDILQTTGYFETPEKMASGVYVLAELLPPAGYVRTEPIPVEIYSDSVVYYPNGTKNKKASIRYGDWMIEDGVLSDVDSETARIFVENTATSLEISKKKTMDSSRAMKVSGRVEGSMTALNLIYGLENLELAYNSSGTYLGFGWKKGTLEYLENRKAAGERVELVYENGVFQGYGYVTRTLETSDDENRYVPGATMALFEAIEVQTSGDTEDFAFQGVEVDRDRNGNVVSIQVKEGYAGEQMKLQMSADGVWSLQAAMRGDTPVLFFDLGGLKVLSQSENDELYGYDRNGQKVKVTFDTKSLFAIRNGRAEFEITGGDFLKLVYDARAKAFTGLDEETVIYHLDEDLCRDALVDGYTGLAYVEKPTEQGTQDRKNCIYVWPVKELKNQNGSVISREKLLTGRPGERNSGTDQAYITGTVEKDSFEKTMNPTYDRYGMVQYYQNRETEYKKGNALYDRDGEYMGYKYEDLLELYNRAAFGVLDPPALYHVGNPEKETDDTPLNHRMGEAWIIPNIWITGEETPQDPMDTWMTLGGEDLLRRVIPGTYILEELSAPDGYVRALPTAVSVEETEKIQRVSMTDETIKIEIAKIDGTDTYKKNVISDESHAEPSWSTEETSAYSGKMIVGAKLALYKADRVYTSDYENYPKGYYLEKAEHKPVGWYWNESMEEDPVYVEAMWISESTPKYFEGIPAGDYILEELETPAGYIPASMEITVKEISELQSFLLKDDHTKLEIYKYEEDENHIKQPLSWPNGAELALYPALLDSNGDVRMEDGAYLYEKNPIAEWETGGQVVFSKEIKEQNPDMVSYEFENGIRRFDRIPVGIYILVETKAPDGYETAEPKLITVKETDAVQRFLFENKKAEVPERRGTLIIEKQDADNEKKKLSDAWFEVTNLQSGEVWRVVTSENGEAVVSGLPIMGTYESGVTGPCIYEIRELFAPTGYRINKTVWQVRFRDNGQEALTHRLVVKDEQTIIHISKTDFASGHFVPGAELAIYETELNNGIFEAKGEALERWTSDHQVHTVKGKLSGGRTYLLVEEEAPEGYAIADPVRFTISLDGTKIVEISENPAQIRMLYHEETGELEAIAVTGRAARKRHLSTKNDEKYHVRMVEDKLLFSDGSEYLVEQQYFSMDSDRDVSQEETGNDPVGTEYVLRNTDGVRMEKWTVENHGPVYVIENSVNADGVWRFLAGQSYYLEEIVVFQDGSRLMTGKSSICFDETGAVTIADMKNRESDLSVKKTDITTGKELPGAVLTIKDENGVVLEEWVSGETEHIIKGILIPGETYILSEKMAADGFSYAEDIVFTTDESGCAVKVVMEDRPTHVEIRKTDLTTGEELPGAALTLKDSSGRIVDHWISGESAHIIRGMLIAGETYTLSEEIAPSGYLVSEEITFTVSKKGEIDKIEIKNRRKSKSVGLEEEPELEPTKKLESGQVKKYGRIIAEYTVGMGNKDELRLEIPANAMVTVVPQTGDQPFPWWAIVGSVLSLTGCAVLLASRRKGCGENQENESRC